MTKLTSRDYAEILAKLNERAKNRSQLEESLNNFIYLLKEKKQLRLLPSIINFYQKKFNQTHQQIIAQITSAKQLDEKAIQEIKKFLATKYPQAKKIIFEFKPLQPALISGCTVQVDDNFWDLSLQKQVSNFEKQLLN